MPPAAGDPAIAMRQAALPAGLAGFAVLGLNVDLMNFRWLWLYLALLPAGADHSAGSAASRAG